MELFCRQTVSLCNRLALNFRLLVHPRERLFCRDSGRTVAYDRYDKGLRAPNQMLVGSFGQINSQTLIANRELSIHSSGVPLVPADYTGEPQFVSQELAGAVVREVSLRDEEAACGELGPSATLSKFSKGTAKVSVRSRLPDAYPCSAESSATIQFLKRLQMCAPRCCVLASAIFRWIEFAFVDSLLDINRVVANLSVADRYKREEVYGG
jgi:hypothetical protein